METTIHKVYLQRDKMNLIYQACTSPLPHSRTHTCSKLTKQSLERLIHSDAPQTYIIFLFIFFCVVFANNYTKNIYVYILLEWRKAIKIRFPWLLFLVSLRILLLFFTFFFKIIYINIKVFISKQTRKKTHFPKSYGCT